MAVMVCLAKIITDYLYTILITVWQLIALWGYQKVQKKMWYFGSEHLVFSIVWQFT